jgi:hypothetical protein
MKYLVYEDTGIAMEVPDNQAEEQAKRIKEQQKRIVKIVDSLEPIIELPQVLPIDEPVLEPVKKIVAKKRK